MQNLMLYKVKSKMFVELNCQLTLSHIHHILTHACTHNIYIYIYRRGHIKIPELQNQQLSRGIKNRFSLKNQGI